MDKNDECWNVGIICDTAVARYEYYPDIEKGEVTGSKLWTGVKLTGKGRRRRRPLQSVRSWGRWVQSADIES